jgi:hypothetical protein
MNQSSYPQRPPRQPVNPWTGVGWLVLALLVLLVIGLVIAAHRQSQLQPGQPAPCISGYVWVPADQACMP